MQKKGFPMKKCLYPLLIVLFLGVFGYAAWQLISTVVVSVVTVYTCRAGGKSPSGVRARAGSMNLVYLLTAAAILFILVHRCVSRFAVVDWRVWLLVMLPSAVVFVMMKLYNRS